MRATMSLPLIFPPTEVNGQVLIDGGTMNNVPADIVKAMGADRVIAVNVGDLSDREGVSYTMFGVAGEHARRDDARLDQARARLGGRRHQRAAQRVWIARLAAGDALIDEGYRAAEAMRDQLLPLAVSEAEFDAWRRGRQARRLTDLPAPAFIELEGFGTSDTTRLNALLARHVGVPLDMSALEADIAARDRAGPVRDRDLAHDARRRAWVTACACTAAPRAYAPPFLMLGMNLENTTSSDFRITATARYLAFDVVGSGSELRLDGTIGSDPTLAVELYRPIGSTPLFVAPYAGVGSVTFNVIDDDAVIARYRQTLSPVGLNVGVNLGARSDLRVGAYLGHTTASIRVGDPGFPELRRQGDRGRDRVAPGHAGQSRGAYGRAAVPGPAVAHFQRSRHRGAGRDLRLRRVADAAVGGGESILERRSTQSGVRLRRRRHVVRRRSLCRPISSHWARLSGSARTVPGELRGPHYYVATGGYLRQVGRLPDFMGGPVFAGGWLENGDAFDEWSQARWRTNGGVGLVMDTLVGPVIVAGSWGFDGRWRTYLGVGRTSADFDR